MPKIDHSLSASEARIPSATFDEVVVKKRRVQVKRRDGASLYLISEDDLRLLQAAEDKRDLKEARAALRRHRANGSKTVSLPALKRRLQG